MVAYRRIAAAYVASLIVEIFNRIAPLIVIHFVTTRIGLAGFGYAQVGMQMIDIAIYFVIAGFHTLGAIDVGRCRGDAKAIAPVVSETLALKLLHAVVAFCMLYLIVSYLPHYRDFRDVVLCLSFLLLTTAIDLSFVNTGTQRVFLTSILTLICRIFALTAVILFVRGHDDALLYAVLSFGSNAFVSLLLVAFNATYLSFKLPGRQAILQRFKHALPFAVTALLMTLLDRFDLFVADYVGGNVMAGLYAAPARLSFSILLIMHVIANVFFSELVHAKDDKVFARYVEMTLFALAVLFLPMVFGVWFVADDLLRLVAGEAFASEGRVLCLLMLATLPQAIIMVCGHLVLQIKKRSLVYNVQLLIGLAVGIALAFLWGRSSLSGIALSMVLARSLVAALVLCFAYRYIGRINLGLIAKVLAASAIMALALYAANLRNVWLNMSLGGLVYGLSLGIIARSDLLLMLHKMRPRPGHR